ncbi:MAG: molecular chaperone GrpE [Thermoplasmata archaeon]|jgi:molecular chaperone GrpE|nr:molecular chaperone GrpE [Thermoplasmata archaeon]
MLIHPSALARRVPNDERPAPPHAPVEGPEESLEPAREQAHEPDGMMARLEALAAREKELLDRLARMQADFENFRRRSRLEVGEAAGRGKEALLKALLPSLDNLDRALAHTEDPGLKAVARGLAGALAAQGIVVLDPAGEAFDAKLHEAIATEAREGAKPGAVLRVAEKGYQIDGRVVRPARVVVAG